jgi:hypothetical protein
MLANVLSELVGIWFAVRLIGIILSQSERRNRARVRAVRNARFIERVVGDILLYHRGSHVVGLRKELAWIARLTLQRKRFLSSDEIRDLSAFYDLVTKFCARILNYENIRPKSMVRFRGKKEALKLFEKMEKARIIAEHNILEETEEDTGM